MDAEQILSGGIVVLILVVLVQAPGCVKRIEEEKHQTFRQAISKGCQIISEQVICPKESK
jgi:hypothetical protein